MAGSKTGKESRKYERAVENAEKSGKIGNGVACSPASFTPNFTFISYGMHEGYRYIALEGSSRSGKTYAALQWCIYAAMKPEAFIRRYDGTGELRPFNGKRLKVRCLRYDAVNARDSIWSDLNKIMEDIGIQSGSAGFVKNETKMTWTFPNGSTIICGGANDPAKLHGLEQDICYFNEAMMIPRSAFDQAEYRTRVAFIFDWNPSLNDHWIFRQGYDKTNVYPPSTHGGLAGKPRCLYAHSTYKDNLKNLTPEQIAGIEQYEPTAENVARGTADAYMWSVYGLGKRGYLEGRIIPTEKVEVSDFFPSAAQWELHGYGLDWGFSADPTALIECAIWNKKLYVRELIYEKNLLVSPDPTLPNSRSVIGLLRELEIKPTDTIVADSARPDLNTALRRAGFCVMDAYKPGGSIENGVNLMNQRRWCVSDASYNLKFELENWTWAKTRYGEQTRKPVDKFNHGMDAIRYWLTTFVDSGNVLKFSAKDDEGNPTKTEYACVIDDWGID